ncbi:MAG: GAF domain-containing protein, partial [Actinomycetota bacterium]
MDELSSIYRVASVGAGRRDTDAMINDLLTTIPEAIPCELPLVLLHEEDALIMHSPTGARGEELSLGEPSVARRVFHHRRGEVVNDLAADMDGVRELDRRRVRQMVASPMISGERCLGVLAACDSHRGAFTEGDLRLLGVLADRAALLFDNLALEASLRRQVQESEALHLLSRLLT